MVKQVRNTDSIVRLAKEKSEKTKVKVEKTISKMMIEGRTINFNTVSKEANVSKSWLYKENDVRKRIESLRNKENIIKNTNEKSRKSTRSEDVLIRTLKDRIKNLEKENKIIKTQLEKLYGERFSKV